MTIREQITEKIGLALESIKTSNGYRTNLGDNVYYFHEVNDQSIEYLAYMDSDEKYEDDNTLRHAELTIDVQAVRYGENYGQLVNEAVDDIIKAVVKNRSLGLKNVQIEPTDSSSDYDLTGRNFVVIQVKFKVIYVTTIQQ